MSDSAETYTPPASTTRPSRRDQTRSMVLAALFCALLAALAWVRIPLPFTPVPLTLQVFVVCLAALILPPAEVAMSIGIYLLLGAAGLPVFSGATGGIGVLLGPTGGYLLGFLVGAFLGSAARVGMNGYGRPTVASDVMAVGITVLTIYGLGWAQLTIVTGMKPLAAFVSGVVPFLFADVLKAAVAIAIARMLRRTALV